MTSKLTELLDEGNNHPLAVEFRQYDAEARRIRAYMEKHNVPQTMGTWNPSESSDVEFDGFSNATSAVHFAMQYITDGRAMTLDDYMELQKRVIGEYPHSIWDNGIWFKRIGKEVRDYSFPVTPEVREVLDQNEVFMLSYLMASHHAHQTGDDIVDVLERMNVGNITRLIIEGDGEYTETLPAPKPSDEALLMYLTLTGKLSRDRMS